MREITFGFVTLKEAIDTLNTYKEHNCPAFGYFNGHKITTEMTRDEIFKEVTGYTEEENNKIIAEREEKAEREKREYEEKIPELEKKWVDWGEANLSPDVQELWEECVPIRLNDLYRGFELDAFKEIFDAWKAGKSNEELKQIFHNQGHSGMSRHLVCSIINTFMSKEIAKYLYDNRG